MRVYSKKRVYELLREAQAHGNYSALLKREGIYPHKMSEKLYGNTVYFPADAVDDLIRDIKA